MTLEQRDIWDTTYVVLFQVGQNSSWSEKDDGWSLWKRFSKKWYGMWMGSEKSRNVNQYSCSQQEFESDDFSSFAWRIIPHIPQSTLEFVGKLGFDHWIIARDLQE